MGAQLRVYRRRVRSVQSTKKITKAMELIAASRIAKAQARMRAARPYAEELTRALAALGKNASLSHPLLSGVDNPRRAGILLITATVAWPAGTARTSSGGRTSWPIG